MNEITAFIIGTLQITLLDFTLSGDNIGVIALATKSLPDKFAKKARLAGVSIAIILRILFACGITYILSVEWLPIKLIGGLLLVKITWDFVKPQKEQDETEVKSSNKFWDAILVIVIADISMSLDNVLAIAGAANGKMSLIVFGILLNIPIIFFGSEFVANLMKKYKLVIYIGGAILAHTAFKMVLEDRLIAVHISNYFAVIFPWFAALSVFLYGIYITKKEKLLDGNISLVHEEIASTKMDDEKTEEFKE